MIKLKSGRLPVALKTIGACFIYRGSKGSLNSPAANSDARPKGLRVEGLQVGPLLKAQGLSFKGDDEVAASIKILLLSSSPSNISRLVVAVVIFSLNRVLRRRSWSDVVIESREVGAPLVTDLDASTAPIAISGMFRVVAPLNHSVPNLKLRTPFAPSSLTMLGILFPPITAARLGRPCPQGGLAGGYEPSTHALTGPVTDTTVRRSDRAVKRLDSKLSELRTDWYIDGGWHVHSPNPSVNLLARLVRLLSQPLGPFSILAQERP